jgi:hypothetical protein
LLLVEFRLQVFRRNCAFHSDLLPTKFSMLREVGSILRNSGLRCQAHLSPVASQSELSRSQGSAATTLRNSSSVKARRVSPRT